jgi:hypothetical protein
MFIATSGNAGATPGALKDLGELASIKPSRAADSASYTGIRGTQRQHRIEYDVKGRDLR